MNTFEQSYDYTCLYYKIGQVDFLILWMYLCNFVDISLCKKESPFHLNKPKSSSHKDALCQVWVKLATWFYRRWYLIFRYFVFIYPWKNERPFIDLNLKLCAKFGRNWPTGSGEDNF